MLIQPDTDDRPEPEDRDHGSLMDAVYRHQASIYDLTRKYYLLGRDRLIKELEVPKDGTVLEIACGTGRNLIRTADRYQAAELFGMDISSPMLRQASRNVKKHSMDWRIHLAKGDACSFDPEEPFKRREFDRIVFSYCLSMIPDWQGALEHSVTLLAPGGRIHMVDFGQQADLPGWFRSGLRSWLGKFHVTPRAETEEVFHDIARRHGLVAEVRSIHRDYAIIGTLTRPQ